MELKNTMTKLKNSIDTFNSRSDHAGERISKFKDKPFHITQLEEQKERRPKKSEDDLGGLWDNIKPINICIIEVPEGAENKSERLFKEII